MRQRLPSTFRCAGCVILFALSDGGSGMRNSFFRVGIFSAALVRKRSLDVGHESSACPISMFNRFVVMAQGVVIMGKRVSRGWADQPFLAKIEH
jgi:hypothetical protein